MCARRYQRNAAQNKWGTDSPFGTRSVSSLRKVFLVRFSLFRLSIRTSCWAVPSSGTLPRATRRSWLPAARPWVRVCCFSDGVFPYATPPPTSLLATPPRVLRPFLLNCNFLGGWGQGSPCSLLGNCLCLLTCRHLHHHRQQLTL